MAPPCRARGLPSWIWRNAFGAWPEKLPRISPFLVVGAGATSDAGKPASGTSPSTMASITASDDLRRGDYSVASQQRLRVGLKALGIGPPLVREADGRRNLRARAVDVDSVANARFTHLCARRPPRAACLVSAAVSASRSGYEENGSTAIMRVSPCAAC